MKKILKNLAIGFFLCTTISTIVTTVPQAIFKDFFFIDDAVNENLPFYKEVGRLVLNGEWPLLTTKTMLGGNLLVDMVISPFSPQTLLTGIIAAKTDSISIPVYFIAWFNAFLISAGCYWMVRGFSLHPLYGALLALTVATSPIYMYFYAASWWNLASSFAWFVVAAAGLLNFALRPNRLHYALACLFSALLFTAAGTQAHLAFFVVVACLSIFAAYKSCEMLALFKISSVALVAVLISCIPIYAEYLISRSLIDRSSDLNNSGNFLVPSLASLLFAFNPYFFNFIHSFGGYRHLPIAIGYAGFFVLPALIFFKKPYFFRKNWIFFTLILSLFLYLLCMSSHQLGPLRYPFRYIPFATLFTSLAAILVIGNNFLEISAKRIVGFGILLFVSLWLQFFSQEAKILTEWNIGLVILLANVFCLVLGVFYLRERFISLQALCVILIAIQLLLSFFAFKATPSLAASKSLCHPKLEPIWPSVSNTGFSLGLSSEPIMQDAASGGCAHYLFHNIKSINGYSPVGNKNFKKFFPHSSPHGGFSRHETLQNITNYIPELGVYVYELFDIQKIYAWKSELPQNLRQKLLGAGLLVEPVPKEFQKASEKVCIMPSRKSHSQGTLSYQADPQLIQSLDASKQAKETWTVQPSSLPRRLIFSRVFWYGYRAYLNGIPLPVSNWRDTLVQVELPPGAEGVLSLSFETVSWKYTKWSMIAGLLVFLLGLYFCKYRPKHLSHLT